MKINITMKQAISRGNKYPVQRGKEEEAKRLRFIPRPRDLANEEEINPYNEGAPRIYGYPSNEKEEKMRWYEERRIRRENRERTEKLKKQMNEELLEELVKIIKEKILLQRLNSKLE